MSWNCPYCGDHCTLKADSDSVSNSHYLTIENADGPRRFGSTFIVCPNDKCKKVSLYAYLYEIKETIKLQGKPLFQDGKMIKHWTLLPESPAKQFPDYIPATILEDYGEACLIKALSPKASATMSRRCLQGIIRDFWSVKPGRLVDEIGQIKDKVDPDTWDAIDSVRKVGNIGAHMEKDINLIVDVEPQEAGLLVNLIEMLLREWYIAREARKERLANIVKISNMKNEAAKGS